MRLKAFHCSCNAGIVVSHPRRKKSPRRHAPSLRHPPLLQEQAVRTLAVEPGDEAGKERVHGGKQRVERGGGLLNGQQGGPPTGAKAEVAHCEVARGDHHEQQQDQRPASAGEPQRRRGAGCGPFPRWRRRPSNCDRRLSPGPRRYMHGETAPSSHSGSRPSAPA